MKVDRVNRAGAIDFEPGIEEDQLRVALIRQLYSQSIIGVIGAQLTAVLLAVALWHVVSHAYIIIWLACYFAVQVPRNILVRSFHKIAPTGKSVLPWGRWFTLLTIVSGLIWGLAGVFLFAADSLFHQFLVAIFLAGISSSAATVYSPVKECYLPSVLLELMPISCRYFYEGDSAHVIMGVAIVLFAAVLVVTGRQMHSMTTDSLRLRFEKNDLIDSLMYEKVRIDHLNEDLKTEIADRKGAEEALRQSETRFRVLVDSVPLGLSVMRPDGKFEFFNRRFTEIFGYTVDDVPDKRTWFLKAYPDKDYRMSVEAVWITDTSDPANAAEVGSRAFTVKCKDGKNKVINFKPVVLADQRHILTYEDVTLQAETERALRESETRYRTLFESADEAIFLMRNDVFVECNRKTLQMFGCDSDGIVGQTPYRFSPPYQPDGRNSRQEALDLINRAFEGERQFFEWQHVRYDGSPLDAEVSLSRLELSGEPFILAIVREITNRKKSEEALRQSEEKYRTIIENSEEGYYETNSEGNLVFFNDSLCKIFGYTREELIGMNYQLFLDDANAQEVSATFHKVFAAEAASGIISAEILRKDGTIRSVETSVSMIKDTSGKTCGFRGIVRDVSERKRAEAELMRLEKLESIGVLAGGIAHDFNNILTAILGNISVAKIYSQEGDKVVERLTAAEKACLHAQGLTQQLLTFSRGGAPVKRVTAIGKLINDSCLFSLGGSNVRCELALSDDLWCVEVDEAQISQVINNLMINADQAMPQGGTIHVRTENVIVTSGDGVPLDSGKYVKLSVKDQGVGIPEEHLSRIFDPYFTTKQRGSGLGLTTAYSIVKNHNGLMAVESDLGVGTTFHVYLPGSGREMDAKESAERQLIKGEGKILLMDDEETIRDLVSEMLGLLGYEVILARNGEEAVALYKEARETLRPFDVVIMDLTVPGGMGGGEAIDVLREIDANINAIVSSGYSNDPIMADYEAHGFRGVVCKPYTIRELSEILRQVIPPKN